MQQSVFDPTLFGANSQLFVQTKRLLDTGTFIALLCMVAVTATPLAASALWWSPIFECIVFVLAAVWAIECLVTDSGGLVNRHLVLPLVALSVFAFVQSVPVSGLASSIPLEGSWATISADPYETKRFSVRFLAFSFVLALLLRHTSTRSRFRALIAVVIAVGLANALLVLVPRVLVSAGFLGDSWDAGFGQFDSRNHFAFLMAMVTGLVMGIAIQARLTLRARLLYVLAVVPLWVALIITSSRGGLLALATAVVFLAFMFGFRRRPASLLNRRVRLGGLGQVSGQFIMKIALAGCLVIALLSSVVLLGGTSLIKRLEQVPIEFSADGRTGGSRMDIWRTTWRVIKGNPLFGAGLGAYGTAITPYHDASGKWIPQQAHNEYLELLAGGGLVAAALGIWFVVVFAKRSILTLRSPDSFKGAACLGALAGIIASAIHSLFDYSLHINTNALVFLALVVIATARVKEESKEFQRIYPAS